MIVTIKHICTHRVYTKGGIHPVAMYALFLIFLNVFTHGDNWRSLPAQDAFGHRPLPL